MKEKPLINDPNAEWIASPKTTIYFLLHYRPISSAYERDVIINLRDEDVMKVWGMSYSKHKEHESK
jgi:hypothetical protein